MVLVVSGNGLLCSRVRDFDWVGDGTGVGGEMQNGTEMGRWRDFRGLEIVEVEVECVGYSLVY